MKTTVRPAPETLNVRLLHSSRAARARFYVRVHLMNACGYKLRLDADKFSIITHEVYIGMVLRPGD